MAKKVRGKSRTSAARKPKSVRRAVAVRKKPPAKKVSEKKVSSKSLPVKKRSAKKATTARGKAKRSVTTITRTARTKPIVAAKPKRKLPAKRAGMLVTMPPSADAPQWTEKLRDGTHVLIRPIRKTDAALERTFIERLSPESSHFRFLGYLKSPSDSLIKQLTDIDYKRDMAFIALVHDAGEKKEVGVSRYSRAADGTSCECAVAVSDGWQGRGLGVLLMRHLIDVARAAGIKRMVSIDSADNTHMRELAKFLGFQRQADPDDTRKVMYSLAL